MELDDKTKCDTFYFQSRKRIKQKQKQLLMKVTLMMYLNQSMLQF